MTSVYQYCTIADVEARANVDYGTLVSPIVDGTVEANISQGEREINTKLGQTFTGTIPDGIKFLAIELAYRRLYNHMVWLGMMDRENPKKEMMPIWDEDMLSILDSYRAKNILPIKNHYMWSDINGIF